eukprot:Skav222033  [mRNA]  locus=scaffold1020:62814:71889:+ [translate_table: standard]
MDRSGQQVATNPFYSERVQDAVQLEAARPGDLPRVPSEEDDGDYQPLGDVTIGVGRGEPPRPTGKGQGSVDAAVAEGRDASGCFETPPSKAPTGLMQSIVGKVNVRLRQSEGRLPPEPEAPVVKTMGPTSAVETTEPGNQPRDDAATGEDDGLQRALEREMVEHLRVQNQRLRDEVQALKAARLREDGSHTSATASWEPVESPPSDLQHQGGRSVTGDRNREASRSPRTHSRMTLGERFTPGGTRVPDGPPPVDDEPIPQPPPLPSFPPLADVLPGGSVAKRPWEGYEVVEEKGYVKKGDREWKPRSCVDVPTPHDAKTFWMDREVASFRAMLEQRYALNSFSGHDYWGHPSGVGTHGGPGRPSGASGSRASTGETDGGDRAVGPNGHGEACDGDRALRHGGLRGRSEVHDGSRALVHGAERDGDRALRRGEHHDHARDLEDGRAIRHGVDREGIRAPLHGAERESDRAMVGDGRFLDGTRIGGRSSSYREPEGLQADLLDAAATINERDAQRERYYANLCEYYKHPSGQGVGDFSLPADHPGSPLWVPPPGGGHSIEFEPRGDERPAGQGGVPYGLSTSLNSTGGSSGSAGSESLFENREESNGLETFGFDAVREEQQPSSEMERAFEGEREDGGLEAQDAAFASSSSSLLRRDSWRRKNPWNEFQKANKGRGWSPTYMAKMYREYKDW